MKRNRLQSTRTKYRSLAPALVRIAKAAKIPEPLRAGVTFTALYVALSLTGCASTELTESWRAPDYTGKLTSLVVVGVSKQASVRRIFEDEFAAQMREKGIRAVPSYTLILQDGPVSEEKLRSAVESAGTDGVIITRLVNVERKVSVTYPGPAYPYPPFYYGYYTTAWIGYYEPPVVQQYDVVTSETTVFARDRAQPVWSGITETFAPGELKKETAEFAKVVITALEKQGLIHSRSAAAQ